MIYPAQRLLILLALVTLAAIPVSLFKLDTLYWWLALGGVGGVALLDALPLFFPHGLSIERKLEGSLPLGVWRQASVQIHNHGKRRQRLQIFDHVPQAFNFRGLPQQVNLANRENATLKYDIEPVERGKFEFETVQLHRGSPMQLWLRNYRIPVANTVRVYPNFATVSKYILLAHDNRISQMGIVKKRRRGEGQDFHQLREYRTGDSLRQIDWKATSRTRKLISREYQDERDQEVIFMLDCGHRMLSRDGELSHFDHTLNAILLLSYVALRQGDAVGLATFDGPQQWLPPHKGPGVQRRILNTVYDLHPGLESPDYSQAAKEVLLHQKKRALVVIITNVRDEDTDDLLPALQLLRRHHLVLLASLRERALDDALEQPVARLDDALRTTATHQYLTHRRRAFDTIRASGVLSLDVIPEDFSVSLVNHYLEIKGAASL